LGIVLGQGGAIAKMIAPFKVFAGGPLGTGRQWFSWIYLDDLVNLIIQGLTKPEMEGAFNATAPNPVRMSELAQTMEKLCSVPRGCQFPALPWKRFWEKGRW
jgi:NAD dependent epimerase/dehydratase family enzyme